MTWEEFIDSLNNTATPKGRIIKFDDGTRIKLVNFEDRFKTDYDSQSPYESLSNSPKTTKGWQEIFDNLKDKDIL